jgi:hypothetical protein
MINEDILRTCMAQLRRLPPVNGVRLIRGGRKSSARGGKGIDALLAVRTEAGQIDFGVQIKNLVRRPIPEHLSITGPQIAKPLLIMTRYVNPSVAESLKERGINFIDTEGNAYINAPRFIYVDIQSRRPSQERQRRPTALFRPKSLQLLYILLTQDEALNDTIRTLQAEAGISFGRTASAMRELAERGYIRKGVDRRFGFADKKALLEQWIASYGERLRPKLVLGEYKMSPSVEDDAPRIVHDTLAAKPQSYALGGSLAAYLLTKYYRGYTTEIFVRPGNADELRQRLRLIPARECNVTLFNLFSPDVIYRTAETPFAVAHPLLVYAELLHQGGGRERETARVIYDTFLRAQYDEH